MNPGAAPPAVGSAAGPPLPTRTWPRALAIVAVVVVGLGAAWASQQDAEREARERQDLVAQQTASLAVTTAQRLLAGVSGVSGLSDASGHVDQARFDAYVAGMLDESPIQTLAYAPIVTADERAAFEYAIGRSISDTPSGTPAPPRDEYIPVQWVTPPLPVTRSLAGLDLGADPVRRAAAESARDTGRAVMTGTVPSQPTGRPAVFLVHAVYRPDMPAEPTVEQRRAAVVGYVTTGVIGDRILGELADELSPAIGIRVEDAGSGRGELFESDVPPEDGVTTEREIAGRTWRITVDDRRPVTTTAPWWILGGTLALAVALAYLAERARRHQREVSRHVAVVERLAGLARSLAAAGSVEEVASIVDSALPQVLEASSASLALVDHGSGTIRSRFGPRVLPAEVAARYVEIPLDAPVPLARAIREGAPVFLASDEDWRAQAPASVADDAIAAGLGATVCQPIADDEGDVIAAIGVSWGHEGPIDELVLATLATAAELCGQTLVRARLADGVRREAVTSRLLAGLAEAAATAGTLEQVARTLVDRAADVPGARSAHIGLLAPDGTVLEVVHHDSLDPAIAARHEREQLDGDSPLVAAYRTGEPVLLADAAAVSERFPALADDVGAAGLASLACFPLLDEGGQAFGALGLAWTAPQHFDEALVDTLRTTADLCASSLGRARRTDLAQLRTGSLAALAGDLSAARSFDDVGRAIIDDAPEALGADFAIVGVVQGDQLHMLAPSGPGLDVPAPYADLDLDGDFPALVALRTRRLVTFSDLAAVADGSVAADLAAMGLRGGACAPLVGGDDVAVGVLSVLWSDPPAFDEALLGRISTVADLCAQSAERAQLFDAEHRVRRDLQARVLPHVPEVPGLDVAARYEPAAPSVGLGGDWYDGIALDGDRLCLVLGDVSGHGIEAIAEMTEIRTVVHTLAAGGMALPDILAQTSASMVREGGGYATIVIAVLDPHRGALTYVTAGHPPPIVRHPDGTVDVLRDGRHSVLGVTMAPRALGRVPFARGATLVAYTDGLIERRGTTIDVSVERLAAQVAAAGDLASAGELADRLLADNRATVPNDDVALVVARRPA
jgi:GAF domain-containing protein/CHASE1-domain containing sensor protein